MRTPIHGLSPRSVGRGRRFGARAALGSKAAANLGPRRSAGELAEQIGRYGASFRLPLEVMAREHPALEDLLFSSPAAAVSIAARRGPPAERGAALNLIRRGAALAQIHAALELPLWLRRLPPEGLLEAPPHPFPLGDFGPPDPDRHYDPKTDARFGRLALNLTPRSAQEWSGWIRWCAASRAAAGDEFAIWLLAHRLRWSRMRPERVLGPLAAYVWFSRRDHLPASRHAAREWTSDFALTAALRNTRNWLLRLLFEIGQPPIGSPWSKSRKVRGYVFEPLIGVDAFVEEGVVMRNCMASYAEAAAEGRCRIYAMKRGGRSVANLEIRPPRAPGEPPLLTQLLGKGNRKPSDAAKRAVRQWLDEVMSEIARRPELNKRETDAFCAQDLELWRLLMEPFLAAHPDAPEIGQSLLAGPHAALDALNAFCRLSRSRDVSFR